jgi:hypothetical protein
MCVSKREGEGMSTKGKETREERRAIEVNPTEEK